MDILQKEIRMPFSLRTITSTDAKSNLGEVLASLNTAGPVEITRNGKVVGLLSPVAHQAMGREQLGKFAVAYSKGSVSWAQISEETGASYGELLVALAAGNLPLPQVTAKKNPAQLALFSKILNGAQSTQRMPNE
jgi:prevent-host-death family protein